MVYWTFSVSRCARSDLAVVDIGMAPEMGQRGAETSPSDDDHSGDVYPE
jgi:hypothetical protein